MKIFDVLLLVFLVISIVYLYIIILITTGISRLRKYVRSGEKPVTKVSVIIPARNEEENIGACLEDLEIQDYPKELYEIVVIDDGSTDQTANMVRDFIRTHASMNIRVIANNKLEKHQAFKKQAIRTAVEITSGDLILTTDADTRSGRGWISTIADFYEQVHPQLIIGPVVFHMEKSFFEKLAGIEFIGLMAATAGSCTMGFPLMCNGANLAFSRQAYKETLDSEEDLQYPSGDDLFLMIKIRKRYGNAAVKYLLSEEAWIRTDAVKSPREFLSQRLRWVSKSRGYSDRYILSTAITTYLFNLFLLGNLVAGLLNKLSFFVFLVLFGAKIIFDFPAVYKISGLFNKKKILPYYPLTQFLNIFYVAMIGSLGNVLPYTWKGRTIKPGKRNPK